MMLPLSRTRTAPRPGPRTARRWLLPIATALAACAGDASGPVEVTGDEHALPLGTYDYVYTFRGLVANAPATVEYRGRMAVVTSTPDSARLTFITDHSLTVDGGERMSMIALFAESAEWDGEAYRMTVTRDGTHREHRLTRQGDGIACTGRVTFDGGASGGSGEAAVCTLTRRQTP
jgi:hypothetical protein